MPRSLDARFVWLLSFLSAVLASCRTTDVAHTPAPAPVVAPPPQREVFGPAIGGVVVSASGEPIVGASVAALPALDARATSDVTDEFGRFLIELSTAGSHDLRVLADGFVAYEERKRLASYSGAHAAGERDVRIELRRLSRVAFRVLDDSTDRPIAGLDLRLLWKPVDGVQRYGGEIEHRGLSMLGGAFTCDVDPTTQCYSIRAAGYAPQQGAIDFDAPNSNVCTIRLRPAAPVRVRALLEGVPAVGVELVVLRTSYRAKSLETGRDEQWLTEDAGDPGPFGVSESGLPFSFRVATARTEENGVAILRGLRTGEHRFEFWGPNGARASLDPVGIVEAEARELGDVALTPGAVLRGRVSLADGSDPATLSLRASAWGRETSAPVAADGSFTLTGLCAGRVRLWFVREPGAPSVAWTRTIELAPGEDKSIEIGLPSNDADEQHR